MTPVFDNLSEVLLSSPEAQAKWLAVSPLHAILEHVGAAEITTCALGSYAPADPNGPHRKLLRLQMQNVFLNIPLPDLSYRGLAMAEGPAAGPRAVLMIDAEEGFVATNLQEIMRVLDPMAPAASLDELKAKFLSLQNTFEQPVPKPALPAFTSRHLGHLEPDRHGRSEAAPLTIAAIADKPLDVSVSELTAEDVTGIDAALDRFLADLTQLKSQAVPDITKNMRDYIHAVYRDPDAPRPDVYADEEFETLLALGDPADIWKHVQPYGLHITRQGKTDPPHHQRISEGPIFVVLDCHCDWEIEHGLSLAWRDGHELAHVGENGGF